MLKKILLILVVGALICTSYAVTFENDSVENALASSNHHISVGTSSANENNLYQ